MSKRINLVLEDSILDLIQIGIDTNGFDDIPSAIRGAIRIAFYKSDVTHPVSQTPKNISLPSERKKKYTEEQIESLYMKSTLEKGRCPKCMDEYGEYMLSSECPCLKSDMGRVNLKVWLQNQYE